MKTTIEYDWLIESQMAENMFEYTKVRAETLYVAANIFLDEYPERGFMTSVHQL